ncbi:UDP-N-acetylmuramate dehydrogenase [Rurimicrobium arvi]|uniref:UDP-N-acetylenolpyruvoylglucosamine reductase n=1 Tax=Rurimicrobium arvi TaxID=2049916 RepID=A0ABP8MWT2_9BACT
MEIQYQVPLKALNTFGIRSVADACVTVKETEELPALSGYTPKYILGGGSNVLLPAHVHGLVIRNELKGIRQTADQDDYVLLEVASGEVWHDFVMFVLSKGWSGVENMALIPGTVGAAPIQNIGAYGVEVKDVIEWVECFEWDSHAIRRLSAPDCRFGYRDSIFKQEYAGKSFITKVCFRLSKKAELNTSYGAIESELAVMGTDHPAPSDVAEAVMRIRRSKLPDPAQIGNAGSFFKNPTIPLAQYETLRETYPDMPSYRVDDSRVKVPAAWLIESCGWKGFREADAGVHQRQSLVLVNYGEANGEQLWALSERIVDSVWEKFQIRPEREVQVW